MRLPLIPHPDTPSKAVRGIDVSVSRHALPKRTSDTLVLDYLVHGALDDMALPPPGPSGRRDGLWEHSCFEAFIRERGGVDYLELNMAPSEQWAAYRFDRYRAGMRSAEAEPQLIARIIEGMFEMAAVTEIALRCDTIWQLGVAAIIEEKDGTKSYWALAHPPGAPDFHHPDCFVLELPPPVPA